LTTGNRQDGKNITKIVRFGNRKHTAESFIFVDTRFREALRFEDFKVIHIHLKLILALVAI